MFADGLFVTIKCDFYWHRFQSSEYLLGIKIVFRYKINDSQYIGLGIIKMRSLDIDFRIVSAQLKAATNFYALRSCENARVNYKYLSRVIFTICTILAYFGVVRTLFLARLPAGYRTPSGGLSSRQIKH